MMERQTQAVAGSAAGNPLLDAPILPTLVRLSVPNMLAMVSSALVAIAETAYVGELGTSALAGLALVFPFIMLIGMLSAGAMGGGVSSSIARAVGAGDVPRAERLSLHAAIIGSVAGVLTTVLLMLFGVAMFVALGGRGQVLRDAVTYASVAFLGAPGIWLTNTFASVVRGGGNMRVPSLVLLAVSVLQVVISGGLGLGLGGLPRLGMTGIAAGLVIAQTAGALFLYWYVTRGGAPIRLPLRGVAISGEMFRDILKVGAVACLSPLQSVLTMLVFTGLVARFGTEALAGYGIGSRLEFLLIPITFGIGVACVPMVGMAMGAGDVTRARRVAWTGGVLSAGITGLVGLVVAVFPDVWSRLFTADAAVLEAARSYFRWVGPCYGLFGLGLCLYFASQGSGRILWPVLAGTARLVVVMAGGWGLATQGAPTWTLFALVAAGMIIYGIASWASVYFVKWPARTR